MVECNFRNFDKIGLSPQYTITSLDQGSPVIMLMVKEQIQNREELEKYTKTSMELVTGTSLELLLDMIPERVKS